MNVTVDTIIACMEACVSTMNTHEPNMKKGKKWIEFVTHTRVRFLGWIWLFTIQRMRFRSSFYTCPLCVTATCTKIANHAYEMFHLTLLHMDFCSTLLLVSRLFFISCSSFDFSPQKKILFHSVVNERTAQKKRRDFKASTKNANTKKFIICSQSCRFALLPNIYIYIYFLSVVLILCVSL